MTPSPAPAMGLMVPLSSKYRSPHVSVVWPEVLYYIVRPVLQIEIKEVVGAVCEVVCGISGRRMGVSTTLRRCQDLYREGGLKALAQVFFIAFYFQAYMFRPRLFPLRRRVA